MTKYLKNLSGRKMYEWSQCTWKHAQNYLLCKLKPQWHTASYILEWLVYKKKILSDKMLEQLNSITSGSVKWCNHFKKIYQLPKNLHIHIPQNLAI